jgi:anti-sigma factor RsiW
MHSRDEDPVHILRYIEGEMKPPERDEFSRHLEDCEECRARVEEEIALSRLFRETAPLYTAPEELRGRVAALAAAAPGSKSRVHTWLKTAAARMGIAIWKPWNRGAGRWLPLLSAGLILLLSLGVLPSLLEESRARQYVEAAVRAHRDTLEGQLPLQIQSDVPETVTQWVGQRVAFPFQLPVVQAVPDETSRFKLVGARLVDLGRENGVIVSYRRQGQSVSLLVASAQAAVVAGGTGVQNEHLLFHYRNAGGFNVITWYNHGLAYALVSSVSGPARQSCLVCHGSLPAR